MNSHCVYMVTTLLHISFTRRDNLCWLHTSVSIMWISVHALLVPVHRETYVTPKRTVVPCLHGTVAKCLTGIGL